jgi:5'-nucleotidase
MKFLITNDDGIHAPGIRALEQAARAFGEVVTVAPLECHSGCGHQTTTNRPLRISKHGEGRFALDGTPADCVRVALEHLARDVDCVLAGVNEGGNLGVDMYISGTVAAVREAMFFGRRGIAFSQYRKTREFNAWEKASRMAASTLPELLELPNEPGSYWNVNLPNEPGDDIPPRVICPVDPHPLSFTFEQIEDTFHYRSNYHGRPRHPQHDIDVCFSGRIAVSKIRHGS